MQCHRLLALAALFAWSGLAIAQSAADFPQRPLKIIAPFPPGGATDVLSRLIGPKLTEAWGQQVVVENRPGGAAVIGTEIVARSPADGYTMGMFLTPHAVNPYVFKSLPYDTLRDFTAVSLVAIVPGILSVHPDVPAKSVAELIALAKAKPGTLAYGTPGPLTSGHLSIEMLKYKAGIEIVHIPYKGGAPAIADLVGGRIQMIINSPPSVIPHMKAGRLRALATTAAKRSTGLPEVPTIAETGVPGFDMFEWYGLFAPGKTSRDVVDKLGREVARIVQLPDIRERIIALGGEPVGNLPDEFGAFFKKEYESWAEISKQIKLSID